LSTGAIEFNILADNATLPGIGRTPPNSDTKKTTALLDLMF
jgi:hypothetical protein